MCFNKNFLNKSTLNLLLGFLLSFLLLACSPDNSSKTLKVYKIAVLPEQSEALLREKYQPLIDHLKSSTGLNCELMIPESYEQLLQWFNGKKIDMALFGGVTYVKAHLQSNALPLVMRDVDGRFRSVVLVSANNPANSLKELKGASLAFGSRLSTSGHIMPRFYFRQENIIVENYFSKLEYSGAHDRTAEWVRDGKVDVGVANSGVVNEMFLDGRLTQDKVKIIWDSPSFSDKVWAVQADISKTNKTLIRDAFLNMNRHNKDKQLLKKLGANYFIPVGRDDFSDLERAVLEIEQLEQGS